MTVDFGTSHTVAVVSGPDLPARLVTIDGQPWFSSAVFWTAQGTPVVGADALRLARAEPARLEPRPKSRITDPEVLLGDLVVPTAALVRAVLATVVEHAAATAGAPAQHLVLTHPANWGSMRIGALLSAAQGLAPRLSTVSEPVAAASWFARQHDFPVGAAVGVLDFGGGTCDAAVVRREPSGLTVVGCAGLPDLGGDDLDQRIIDWIRADVPSVADLLDEQQRSRPDQMAALLRLRDDVRAAKEVLSRHPQVDIAMPDGLTDRLLTRLEFERLVSGELARAVGLLADVVTGCGLRPEELHAVHLVGGAGQVPLLGVMLGAAFGPKVRLDETPQSVVAIGGHHLTVADAGAPPATERIDTVGAATGPVPTIARPVAPAAPARRLLWPIAVVAPVVAAVVALVAATTIALSGDRTVSGDPRAEAATSEHLSVPPPADGDPVTVPGRSTQYLPTVEKGATVQYDAGGKTMSWRLDAFVDTPQQSAQLAEAGVPTDDSQRLVLVRITIGAVAEEAVPDDIAAWTYLVDDRGLMISATPEFRMAGCPQWKFNTPLRPGHDTQVCLAYRVGRTAPVTEVALTTEATPTPGVTTPTELARGARVIVSGQRVDGQAQPVSGRSLPLLVPHTFRLDDGSVEVAVADLVEDPSAYFSSEPLGLPGARAVLVRIAVRATVRQTVVLPLRVVLHDDRSTQVEAARTVPTTAHGCLPEDKLVGGTDVKLYCLVFAVPTATPLRDVEVSARGSDPTAWVTS